MASVQFKGKSEEYSTKYFIEDWLKKKIDDKIIPALQKRDKDYVICMDGKEGSGKSTLGLQIGRYIDPSLDLTRIVFSAEQFKEAIFKAKKGQVIIYDEAFTGLSSRSSLSGINRYLVSLMMQMRQKNLCVILILPTFFLLDRYPAIFRSKILIHVYENKGRRGYFRIYNSRKKTQLWLTGKKDYTYKVRTRLRGHFYGVFALGDVTIEDKYRDIKAKALEATERDPMSSGQIKYRDQRDLVIFLIRKITGLTYEKISNFFGDYDLDLSNVQIRNICAKRGDKGRQKLEETRDLLQSLLKESEISSLTKEQEQNEGLESDFSSNEDINDDFSPNEDINDDFSANEVKSSGKNIESEDNLGI